MSVIVPAHDAVDTLAALLRSLQALDYPVDRHELIVVDNRSNDGTWRLLQSTPGIKALQETFRPSSYAARNRGWREARGEILAFTDADCEVDAAWLRRLVETFDDDSVGAVAGSIEPRSLAHPLQRLSHERGLLSQQRYLRAKPVPVAATANLAVRARVLQALGGFDPTVWTAGDFYLCYRLQTELGLRLEFAPQAVVLHHHRDSLRGIYQQAVRGGVAYSLLRRRIAGFELPPPGQGHAVEIMRSLGGLRRIAIDANVRWELAYAAVRYGGFALGFARQWLASCFSNRGTLP